MPRRKFICLSAILVLFLAVPAWAETFSGKVVSVLDGDTIEVMHRGRAVRIRLQGIDCPERGQAFGNRAKQFTSRAAFGKTVTVRFTEQDKYNRILGTVLLPDGGNLNRELVKAGLAWWYRQYSMDRSLGQLEAEARAARRGLWRDPHPVPPWDFRRSR
ncbi:MAG: thermonuclease family protein [Deltaproteobacteria bacterium]|nr:thermonuclease family protein [Deltaproteobacteria bacterium]